MNKNSTSEGRLLRQAGTLSSAIARAMSWWIARLSELMPASVNNRLRQDSLSLILAMQDEQLVINAGQQRWVLTPPWDIGSIPDDLRRIINHSQSITLCLPQSISLRTRITVPKNAREYIDNVARFEMDRLTPFKAEQVYYDTGTITDHPGGEQSSVELFLVPKEKLTQTLDALSRMDLSPDRIIPAEFLGKPDSINLLPSVSSTSKKARYQRIQWGLLTANLILLIAVFSLPLIEKQNQIDELSDQVEEMREKAEQVFDIRDQRQHLFQQQASYVEIRQQQNSSLDLIDELTRLMPDTVWLNKIALEKNNLRIQGEADNASDLIPLLQNSDRLTGVSFFSPVTQNPRTGKERFMISAELDQGATL